MRTLTIPLVLVAALPACSGSSHVVLGEAPELVDVAAYPNRDLDLLFVIDNSDSMADKQASLIANFPEMMNVLSTMPGGMPNLHIGVVTSDMGTYGSVTNTVGSDVGTIGSGGCGGTGDDGLLQIGSLGSAISDRYISDIDNGDGTRTKNYTGSLADTFTAMATVGTLGCGFEQHLESMRQGLSNPENAGFVRDSANLGVIVVADEDDCSIADPHVLDVDNVDGLGVLQSYRCTKFGVTCDQPMDDVGAKTNCHPSEDSPYISGVQQYVDFLTGLKGDARKLMTAAIAGPSTPFAVTQWPDTIGSFLSNQPELEHSCMYTDGSDQESADPALRLASWVNGFPGRGNFDTICQSDLTAPLQTIGTTARKLVGDPCFDGSVGPLADESDADGLQPDCVVFDVRDSAPDHQTVLPSCDTTSGVDCYTISEDATACPFSQGNLKVAVTRMSAPATDTWTHVTCTLAAATN